MCEATADFEGNKVPQCQVGDLLPGAKFRTPGRATYMVLAMPEAFPEPIEGDCIVVDIETGQVAVVSTSLNLGRDRAGRLYASRSLNDDPDYGVDLNNLPSL